MIQSKTNIQIHGIAQPPGVIMVEAFELLGKRMRFGRGAQEELKVIVRSKGGIETKFFILGGTFDRLED